MIYFILTLFFGSLLGIIFMIGRKLILIQSGQVPDYFENDQGEQYWEEFKYGVRLGLKKLSYALLVIIIRLYVKLINFLKNTYHEVALKVKDMYIKKSASGATEPREVSKFLKMVGQYKRKIRRIKEIVKEEESL